MKKKTFLLFLTVLCLISMLGTTVCAAWSPGYGVNVNMVRKTYKVTNVTKVGDEFSNWKRLSTVYSYRNAGSGSHGESKTYTKTLSVSFGVDFPITKSITGSAGLDYTLSESKQFTIYQANCKELQKKEAAAFYYREHYEVLNVEYEITTVKMSTPPQLTLGGGVSRAPQVYTACGFKQIKVPKGINEATSDGKHTIDEAEYIEKYGSDYDWFYAPNGSQSTLRKELRASECNFDTATCRKVVK